MLLFALLLIDLSLFSIISIPVYRLLCDQSIVVSISNISTIFCLITSPSYFHVASLDELVVHSCNTQLVCEYSIVYSAFNDVTGCLYGVWFFFYFPSRTFVYNLPSILEISLYVRRSPLGLLEFYSLQRQLCLFYDEISLAFFRVYNPTYYSCTCLFIYLVYPLISSVYVNKVQCFCFESLVVHPFETFDLPVLFFICSELQHTSNFLSDRLALLYVSFLL